MSTNITTQMKTIYGDTNLTIIAGSLVYKTEIFKKKNNSSQKAKENSLPFGRYPGL